MRDGIDPELKKEIAKVGLTLALAVTVFTAPFMRRRPGIRKLHTAAGVVLAGLSLWHQQLYRPQRVAAKTPARLEADGRVE